MDKYIDLLKIDGFQIKFVFSNQHYKQDLEDINSILDKVNIKIETNIIIQPEGLTEDIGNYSLRGAKLAESFVVEKINPLFEKYPNARIMAQMHKFFWMNIIRKNLGEERILFGEIDEVGRSELYSGC